MPLHVVQPGECVASVAYAHGLFPDTVWGHPENAALRAKRKEGAVLAPGDRLFVPERSPAEYDVATGASHTFVRRGVPAKLVLVYERPDGEPWASEPYELDVDGDVREGTTGGDGRLEEWVPPDAKRARVTFPSLEWSCEYPLRHLNPVYNPAGVAARLNLLGFGAGDPEAPEAGVLERALAAFQRAAGLEESGEPDGPTLAALVERVGC